MAIQSPNENSLLIEVPDFAPSKKNCNIRVLHVDDDVSFLEVSKRVLSMENDFEITDVESVDEAFKRLEEETYDVIVSDYEMPLKNGLDFLKCLREKNLQLPFILFLGKERDDVAVKALNLGADRYLNKNGPPEAVYCELAHAIKQTVEQRKSAQLLALSNSKYRMLVQKSLQGILVAQDAPLRMVFANESMGKMTGYSPEELISLPSSEVGSLIFHEDRSIFFDHIRNLLKGQQDNNRFEFRWVRKDRSIVWIQAFATLIEYDGKASVQAMFLDITESKKTEEILKKSEERYRELANFLPEIVLETDITGKITFFNKRAFEITGFTPEELEKGMEFVSFVVPEEREKAIENLAKSLIGENLGNTEFTLVRKNGSTFPALVRTNPIISETKVRGIRGIVMDISDRRQMENKLEEYSKHLEELIETRTQELNETQQQLVKSERLAVIGELAGMLGHDLRDPLTGIRNAVYFLKKKGGAIPEAQAKEMLEIINKCLDHSDKIINDLLGYSKEIQLEYQESSPQELMLAALDSISLPERIKIINNAQAIPNIKVDTNKITEVFIRLIKNGIDAIPNEGTITIDCKSTKDTVEISIMDTGVGISEKILPKIFSPMVTTKDKRMGFGLAICKRIINAHEGTITAQPNNGKGATFTVVLPIKPISEIKLEIEMLNRKAKENSLQNCIGLFNCLNPEKCRNYEECLKRYLHNEAGNEILNFYF